MLQNARKVTAEIAEAHAESDFIWESDLFSTPFFRMGILCLS